MKKITFFIFSFCLFSCSKENIPIKNSNIKNNITNIRIFKSKDELKQLIESPDEIPPTKSENFNSAESITEEKTEIEFIVPNSKIRTILNDKMEVIVNDTIYKVTKEGTFYTNIQNINELEYAVEHIDLFSNTSNKLKKYKDIYLYDSHNLWNTHEDNPITNANYFDDPDDELYGEEDDIENDVIQTRSVHRNITDEDFESFPTMGIVKAKILGKVLELVFNKTSYNKYRFKSNRRRKLYVSFYNKDYVFYRSGGFDVKVMKKLWHGGWGRMKTWSCGVYTGFSQIRIKHTLSNFMSSELNSFVKNIHEEQKNI